MKQKVLFIGASTGGPSLIKELLSQIKSLSTTIIIAQHMKEEVLEYYIKDLQESLSVKVCATPTQTNFQNPCIIVCAHSAIIEKRGSHYLFTTERNEQMYTPDINKLFNSFVPYTKSFECKVLIMTGIGRDGVEGALNLKKSGALLYAQDEKTSPVFGMPKALIESGKVDEIKSFAALKTLFKAL